MSVSSVIGPRSVKDDAEPEPPIAIAEHVVWNARSLRMHWLSLEFDDPALEAQLTTDIFGYVAPIAMFANVLHSLSLWSVLVVDEHLWTSPLIPIILLNFTAFTSTAFCRSLGDTAAAHRMFSQCSVANLCLGNLLFLPPTVLYSLDFGSDCHAGAQPFGLTAFSITFMLASILVVANLACFPWRYRLAISALLVPPAHYASTTECMRAQWFMIPCGFAVGELLGYPLQWMLRSLWLMGFSRSARKDLELRRQELHILEMEVARREQLTLQQLLVARLRPKARQVHSELLRGFHKARMPWMTPIEEDFVQEGAPSDERAGLSGSTQKEHDD